MSSQTPFLDAVPQEPSMPAGSIDRAEHTRLRRRMLYGQWREDLRARVRTELNSVERAEAWGEPDLTGNVFTPACATLAALYSPDPPVATAPPGGEELLQIVEYAGLWQLMVRVQRDTIGLREMLLRIEVLGNELVYTPVFPDRVVARAGFGARDVPAYVSEARFEQMEGDERAIWYWHTYDISDPAAPSYTVAPDSDRTDVRFRADGDEYPVWLGDEPLLPYTLYHAERTGSLFDPWEWVEVVEGALRLGVLWTYFGHTVRNASWPQRYMIGAFVAGTSVDETGGAPPRVRVVADPARVLTLVTEPDTAVSPQIGQWGPGADPEALAGAIGAYERRIIGLAGLDAATVARKDGDPRSGYALAVSQDVRSDLRRRFEPQFRRGDLQTLRTTAAALNTALGTDYPGDGYVITYGAPLVAAPAPALEADPAPVVPAPENPE